MKHDPRPEYNPRQRDVPKEESAKTDTPQTTPREEWEEFDIRFSVQHIAWATPIVLKKEIQDFIRETRAAAYEEGLQAALKAVDSMNARDSGLTAGDHIDGYESAQDDANTAISTLLK